MSLHHFCNKIFNSAKTEERLIKTGGLQAKCPFPPPFISLSVIRNVPLYLREHREYFRLTRNLCQWGWADFRNADLLMCFLHINYWWTPKHIHSAVSISAGLRPTCYKCCRLVQSWDQHHGERPHAWGLKRERPQPSAQTFLMVGLYS